MAVKKATTTEDIKSADSPSEGGRFVVVSPAGVRTEVPESILQVLLDSGYKKASK